MAKYVPDTYTNRWVIFATQRAFRPQEVLEDCKKKTSTNHIVKKHGYSYKESCPFCLGNEKMTPSEVYRWGKHEDRLHRLKDDDWMVRVIPNKYPISDIHEVVIHSPDHLKSSVDFSQEHMEVLMKVFLQRYQALAKKGTVIIFTNKGSESGESLTHPHSQIVVLPRQIKLQVLSLQPVNNIVEETAHYVVYCPDFSQWTYETWISLKRLHAPSYVDTGIDYFGNIKDDELTELAKVLQRTLSKFEKKFPKTSYNYYIHPYSPWYLRIMPRFVIRAGFELGTGLIVNIKDPAVAAKELRSNK